MKFVSAQFKAHLYNDLVSADDLNLLIVMSFKNETRRSQSVIFFFFPQKTHLYSPFKGLFFKTFFWACIMLTDCG